MKNFFAILFLFTSLSTNFVFAENFYKQQILCGILDIGCVMEKISTFGNNFFSTISEKKSNDDILQPKIDSSNATQIKTNKNSDLEDVKISQVEEKEKTPVEEEVKKKDDSLLCKILPVTCSDYKKESIPDKNLDSLDASSSQDFFGRPVNDPENLLSDYQSLDPNNSDYSNRDESFYSSPQYQALGNSIDHDGDSVYGQELPVKDLDQSKIDGAFIDPGSGDCGNYGIVLSGSNSGRYPASTLSSKIKQDTKKLCSLTGKKLHVTSGRRAGLPESNGCFVQSQHNCGHAMDTSFDPFKTDEEKTIIMLYFMAHGYNGIGSYGLTVPIHIDHRNAPMRWGPGGANGKSYRLMYCAIRHWPNYAKQAFLRAKLQPCQLVSTNTVSANAKAALIQMGKPQFAE